MQDLKRWADRYDLPFGDIPKARDYSRINKGVFYAIAHDAADSYIAAAYATVWGRGGDANDDSELEALAQLLDWDVGEFFQYLQSAEATDAFEKSNAEAIASGIFGVPIVTFEGDMWWGNDRLDFLQEKLENL